MVCFKYSKNWVYRREHREICYIWGMKKQELFKISDEGAALIRQYDEIFHTDESQFFNPCGKKNRLLNTINQLRAELNDVDDISPSFDGVAQVASQVLEQCGEEEGKTRYDKTKRQMLGDIVAKLRPIVTDALMGKNVCLKSGPDNFQYFKVDEVNVAVGMYDSLCISFKGLGFEIWPKAFNRMGNAFPTFGARSGKGIDLIMNGKADSEWLYVLSDEEMHRVFEETVADMGKTLEIPGYRDAEV